MKNRGFTLIELIVVVIIIGILASIAAPIMNGMQVKTICSEAIVGMSAIREALREYYAEYGAYPIPLVVEGTGNFSYVDNKGLTSAQLPGLTIRNLGTYGGSTLDGTYFSQECYSIWPASDEIICNPSPTNSNPGNKFTNLAPRALAVLNTLDQNVADYDAGIHMAISNGAITQSDFSQSGYPVDYVYPMPPN